MRIIALILATTNGLGVSSSEQSAEPLKRTAKALWVDIQRKAICPTTPAPVEKKTWAPAQSHAQTSFPKRSQCLVLL